jgi:hypothetical protein
MDFFNQGTDQGFAIQVYFVFGLDLGEDFGDMEGFSGLPEYV